MRQCKLTINKTYIIKRGVNKIPSLDPKTRIVRVIYREHSKHSIICMLIKNIAHCDCEGVGSFAYV